MCHYHDYHVVGSYSDGEDDGTDECPSLPGIIFAACSRSCCVSCICAVAVVCSAFSMISDYAPLEDVAF